MILKMGLADQPKLRGWVEVDERAELRHRLWVEGRLTHGTEARSLQQHETWQWRPGRCYHGPRELMTTHEALVIWVHESIQGGTTSAYVIPEPLQARAPQATGTPMLLHTQFNPSKTQVYSHLLGPWHPVQCTLRSTSSFAPLAP